MRLVAGLVWIGAIRVTASEIVQFEAGKPALAREINGNFQELVRRIDSLSTLVLAQSSWRDSIAALRSASRDDLSWRDSLAVLRAKFKADSLHGAELAFAKGAVAGFLVEPGSDGYLPGSGKAWVYAAGQRLETGDSVPDLRGQFLRGIDYVVTGRPATGLDPEGTRKAGSGQSDAFQGHRHAYDGTPVVAKPPQQYGAGGAYGFYAASGVLDPIPDGIHGNPRTASETRPKNIAVYWYVKVK